MKEVENKWSTLKLNDEIWAKLIYFERNRRLAKAYVSAPVLTIDGSTNGLDGFRIGLSGIDNDYRDLDSISCLRSIGLGIKLKIDSQGNILIKKVLSNSKIDQTTTNVGDSSRQAHLKQNNKMQQQQQCSIWLKEWPLKNKENFNLTNDSCSMMKEISNDQLYSKLFDMRKFRIQLEKMALARNNRRNNNNLHKNNINKIEIGDFNDIIDWRQCVSIISFVYNNDHDSSVLNEPCWLMIINIIAIDMLKSLLLSCDRRERVIANSKLIKSPSATNLIGLFTPPTNYINNNNNLSRQKDRIRLSNNVTRESGPLRTSSSAAILFPSASSASSSSSSTNNTLEQTSKIRTGKTLAESFAFPSVPGTVCADTSSSNDSPVIDYDRFKKMRTTTTTTRHGILSPPSIKNNDRSSHQQLSSSFAHLPQTNNNNNSTIYTTFNSKYINRSIHSKDSSSISDYNSSVSRSISSGSGYNNNQNYISGGWRKQPIYSPNNSLIYNHHYQQQNNNNYNNRYSRYINRSAQLNHYYPFMSRKSFINEYTNLNSTSTSPSTVIRNQNTSNKSLSLSNFDLSQRKLTELRSMQSAIKMNYDDDDDNDDDFSETDQDQEDFDNIHKLYTNKDDNCDAFDEEVEDIETIQEEEQQQSTNNTTSNRCNKLNKLLFQDNNRIDELSYSHCCNNIEKLQQLVADSSDCLKNIDHINECNAIKGISNKKIIVVDKKANSSEIIINNNKDKEHKKDEETTQPSRASIGSSASSSSSSSSGCADNDYFMSQSSSSMSSSTGTQERELFSQPTSSTSGIVCSGSTSDEYDDVGARKSNNSDNKNNTTREEQEKKESIESKDKEEKKQQQHVDDNETKMVVKSNKSINLIAKKSKTNRGVNVKTLEPSDGYGCAQTKLMEKSIVTNYNNKNGGTTCITKDSCSVASTTSSGLVDCDCPYSIRNGDNFDNCDDCSCCNYSIDNTTNNKKELILNQSSQHIACNCNVVPVSDDDDDSIYSRLPHPVALLDNKQSNGDNKYNSPDSYSILGVGGVVIRKNGNKFKNATSNSSEVLNKLTIKDDYFRLYKKKSISTIPMHEDVVVVAVDGDVTKQQTQSNSFSKKDSKHDSGGWLAKGKYSRILPKFIFSSSSTSSSSSSSRQAKQASTQASKNTIINNGKSSTLDKNVKYKLTSRSNLDLS